MVRIVTDSASDMEKEELEKYSVTSIPLSVSFGNNCYLDGVTLDKDMFYELLETAEEFPKTSQPSPESFLTVFNEAKEAGDSVIAILVSGALSGTVQSAVIAKSMSGYDDIHIIDSKTATGGEQLLIYYAVSLRDKGYSAEAIAREVEKLACRNRLFASLDTLEYLCKGGRLSKTAAGIGSLVNLKPIITITEEGAVGIAEKCIGKKNVLSKLSRYPEKTGIDTRFPLCFLYSHDRTNCDEVMKKMEESGFDMENILVVNIGPTIGSHIGIGAVGLIYFALEEN